MKRLPFALLLLVSAGALFSQDGLYAPSVPEDAALVRVVNATNEPLSVDLGPLRYDVGPRSASAYRPLQPGIFVVALGGERTVVEPPARAFLSVVASPVGITVFTDERHTDPARSQLVVYNVGSQPLEFRAVSPEAGLVPDVMPGASGARVVNAIRVEVGAFVGDDPVATARLDLERGESYALVVPASGSGVPGFVVRASVSSE